jgi:L,D-peptidoglycan transpeptidase YkuD (ErfK/YbiS/YcfS/YnhG family)
LTFFTENAVEWILAWSRWWCDEDLEIHHFGPGAVSFDTECGDTLKHFIVQVVDLAVQLRYNDETRENGHGAACCRNTDDQLGLLHFGR